MGRLASTRKRRSCAIRLCDSNNLRFVWRKPKTRFDVKTRLGSTGPARDLPRCLSRGGIKSIFYSRRQPRVLDALTCAMLPCRSLRRERGGRLLKGARRLFLMRLHRTEFGAFLGRRVATSPRFAVFAGVASLPREACLPCRLLGGAGR